jgi:hypothetical protein
VEVLLRPAVFCVWFVRAFSTAICFSQSPSIEGNWEEKMRKQNVVGGWAGDSGTDKFWGKPDNL